MDKIYQNLITLTREKLDIKRMTSMPGRKKRPHNHSKKTGRIQVRIEKPDYNLTIFKIHYGKITLKLYDKGERILRSEIVVHNTKDLKCKRSLSNFAEIVGKLKEIMKSFMDNLSYMHVSLLDFEALQKITAPSRKGDKRLAGIDIMNKRNIAVMESLISLSIKPQGYTAKDVALLMQEKLGKREAKKYTPSKAGYDIRKFRGKLLVKKRGEKERKYLTTKKGVETMTAILVLTQKNMPAILSAINENNTSKNCETGNELDNIYLNIVKQIKDMNSYWGLATAA